MPRYILRRFCEMVLTLFLVATGTFFLLAAVPGNALSQKINKLPAATQERVLQKYGYDKPVLERYVVTLKNYVINRDFGESIVQAGDTVSGIISSKLPVSARLGIQQILIGVTLGILLGTIAAMKRNTIIDYIILVSSMLLKSVPTIVLALLLQKYLTKGTIFNFPIVGWASGKELLFGGWQYTILPTIAGAGGYLAYYCRLTKTSMLDSINQEYTLTARSKGLSEASIVRKHVLRNSFIPIITVLPVTVAGIMEGAFFIENVFAIPGIGKYFISAVSQRDVPIVMGLTVFSASIYISAIFITDILYTIVDPRIKLAK